jgi:hypothetical protein
MSYKKRIAIFFLSCFAVLIVACAKNLAIAQESTNSQTDLGAAPKDFFQLSEGKENKILTAIGLPQANDFGLVKIAGYIIFGAIGFVAFVYGKKNKFWRPMIIGIALMAYPYFFSGTLVIYLVGIALTAALYFWRE